MDRASSSVSSVIYHELINQPILQVEERKKTIKY